MTYVELYFVITCTVFVWDKYKQLLEYHDEFLKCPNIGRTTLSKQGMYLINIQQGSRGYTQKSSGLQSESKNNIISVNTNFKLFHNLLGDDKFENANT